MALFCFDDLLPIRRRRNVDFYQDLGGRHPIRGTEGYDEYLAGDMVGSKRGSGAHRERMGYLAEMRAYSRSMPPLPRGPKGSGAAARAARAGRAQAARSRPRDTGSGVAAAILGRRTEAAYERMTRRRNPRRRKGGKR